MLYEPEKLSEAVQEILQSENNTLYASAVSFWEISMKASLGRVAIPETDLSELPEHAMKSGILPADLSVAQCSTYGTLTYVAGHKDLFDRMLIHQCIDLRYVLISSDLVFEKYREFGLILVQN
jgi:PIN domain nuclease of toxin-antitoxin system